MKNNRIGISIIAITFMFFTACSQSDIDAETSGTIHITEGIAGFTKSPVLDEDGAGNFKQGDIIAVTVTSGNGSKRIQHTVGDDTPLYWKDLDFTQENGTATFSGCYPVPEIESEEGQFIFNISEAKVKDLLLAQAVETEIGKNAEIMLAFKHAMHLLKINYSSDGSFSESQLASAKMTCTAKAECEISLKEGTVLSATGNETEFTEQGSRIEFLLVPQASEYVALQIEINGKTFSCSLPELQDKLENNGEIPQSLESGKSLILNLNITSEGITIRNTEIGKWENQGTVDGEIEI